MKKFGDCFTERPDKIVLSKKLSKFGHIVVQNLATLLAR
jgi:hypothetical protein